MYVIIFFLRFIALYFFSVVVILQDTATLTSELSKSDESQKADPLQNLFQQDLIPDFDILANDNILMETSNSSQSLENGGLLDLINDKSVVETQNNPFNSLECSNSGIEITKSQLQATNKDICVEHGESAVPTHHRCSICRKYFKLKSFLQKHHKQCLGITLTSTNDNHTTKQKTNELPATELAPIAISSTASVIKDSLNIISENSNNLLHSNIPILPSNTATTNRLDQCTQISSLPQITLLSTPPASTSENINALHFENTSNVQMSSQAQSTSVLLIPATSLFMGNTNQTVSLRSQTNGTHVSMNTNVQSTEATKDSLNWPTHYECALCNRSFRLKSTLTRHNLMCKRKKDLRTKTTINTQEHAKESHTVNTDASMIGEGANSNLMYECSFCQKQFKFFSYLQKHLLSSKLRRCEWCNVSFHMKTKDFQNHVLSCAKACESCGKKETSPSLLEKHRKKKHFHRCVFCKTLFPKLEDLQKHDCDQIPTCPNCGKTYRDRYNLDRHVSFCRFKSEDLNCKLCKKVLHSYKALKRHEQVCSKRHYRCRICKGMFLTKEKRNNHEKVCGLYDRKWSVISSYKCPVCKKEFKDKHFLYYHQKKTSKFKSVWVWRTARKYSSSSRHTLFS